MRDTELVVTAGSYQTLRSPKPLRSTSRFEALLLFRLRTSWTIGLSTFDDARCYLQFAVWKVAGIKSRSMVGLVGLSLAFAQAAINAQTYCHYISSEVSAQSSARTGAMLSFVI